MCGKSAVHGHEHQAESVGNLALCGQLPDNPCKEAANRIGRRYPPCVEVVSSDPRSAFESMCTKGTSEHSSESYDMKRVPSVDTHRQHELGGDRLRMAPDLHMNEEAFSARGNSGDEGPGGVVIERIQPNYFGFQHVHSHVNPNRRNQSHRNLT